MNDYEAPAITTSIRIELTELCKCGHAFSYHQTPGSECIFQLKPDPEPIDYSKPNLTVYCQCSWFKHA